MMPVHPKNPFTSSELARLKEEWRKGTAQKQICFMLNKTHNEVRGKLESLFRKGELEPRKRQGGTARASTRLERELYISARQRARIRGLNFSGYLRNLVVRDVGL